MTDDDNDADDEDDDDDYDDDNHLIGKFCRPESRFQWWQGEGNQPGRGFGLR